MYRLAITIGHFDDESGDPLLTFTERFVKDKKVKSFNAEVVEENHVSGVIEFEIEPKKYETIVGQMQDLIDEYGVHQECFSLKDNLGNEILTEESWEI